MTADLTLGPALRRARHRANLSQHDLAEQLRVSVRSVSYWESPTHPQPHPRHRARLARFLAENGEAA